MKTQAGRCKNRSMRPLSTFPLPRLICLLFACALLASSFAVDPAYGQRRSRRSKVDYGRIEITTTEGEYPVLVDGVPNGQTSRTVRYLDLSPGRHTVEIQFPNARWTRDFSVVAGERICIALNYTPRTIEVARPVPIVSPCPYTVTVSAPASVSDGDIITFTSDVTYNGPNRLNYMWTVSPASARITSGNSTPTITVDSTGLGRQSMTAILLVDDGSGDPRCRQSAQATTTVIAPPTPRLEPRRIDEFPSISFDDDKARLDNFAVELQSDPTARGFIIAYAGRRSGAGTADRLANRSRDYLVATRGIDPARIVTINGGFRERDYIELYVVPQGAEPPPPTSSLAPESEPTATPRRAPRRSRRR